MSLLHTIVAFIVALGVLILFHELGHYVVARWCGVKVLRFSIGFGRPLLMWRGRAPDRTEWVLAAVPLGGYVRMLDEREGPVASAELARAFNRQSVLKRMAIVAAGPLANFALAMLIYFALFIHGTSEPKPILGAPVAETPAARGGVANGDVVTAVNGKPVATWNDVRWDVLELAVSRKPVDLNVTDAGGYRRLRHLDFSSYDADANTKDPWAPVGLQLYEPEIPPVIGRLEPGQPAQLAGVQPGDRVLRIDGNPVRSWAEFVRDIQSRPGARVSLEIEKPNGTTATLAITLGTDSRRGTPIGRIGAGPRVDESAYRDLYVEQRYGPLPAVGKAVAKTWDMAVFSLRMLGKMVIGELSWRNLSGPVTIADYAGQSANQGLIPYVVFIALISISIGVLNLLPIPVLDGGHLLYYFLEVVMGRPLSDRWIELGQRAGLGVLLALMAFAIFNDITRHLTG